MQLSEITTLIQMIVPYIVMGKCDWVIIVTVMFVPMAHYLYNKTQKYLTADLCEIQIHAAKKWWESNDTYEHIDTFLAQQKDTKVYNNEEFQCLQLVPNTNLRSGRPIITSGFCTSKIQHEGHTILISKELSAQPHESKEQHSFFLVRGPTIDVLQSFIALCQEHYIQYHKSVVDNYAIYSYSDKRWNKKSINVTKSFANVFLTADTKTMLVDFLRKRQLPEYKEINARLGVPNKTCFLFYGKPGCGKTSSVILLAKETGMPIYKIPALSDMDNTLISDMLNSIPHSAIVFFDDIDCCSDFHVRTEQDDRPPSGDPFVFKKQNNDKLGILLEYLDGYYSLCDSIVVLATNHPDKLDPAVTRPGRVDHRVEFVEPNDKSLAECFPDIKTDPKWHLSETLHLYRNDLMDKTVPIII